MPKKRDFETQGCQVEETKKIEEKLDLHSLRLLSGGNATSPMWWYGGVPHTKNYRRLVVMRNTTHLHNMKRCTLECCVGSHISWQVVYVEIGLLTFNRVQNKHRGRMLPQLLPTDNKNGISVITISPH